MGLMRQLLVSAALAASAVASAPIALAAPPSVPSWTGFYAGANIGYGFGDAKTGTAGSATSISFPTVTPVTNNFPFASAQKQGMDGLLGGAQVGYNYQYSARWVLGFEADIQGSAQRGSKTFADALAGSNPSRRRRNGSIDPAREPNVTMPTSATPTVSRTPAIINPTRLTSG